MNGVAKPLLVGVGLGVAVMAGVFVFAVLAGGGDERGGDPLENPDAEAQEVIDAWSEVACHGAAVQDVDDSLLEGDKVAAAYCELDTAGTLEQKRQSISVFDSEAAVDTYMNGRDCEGYLYVTGPRWVAVGLIREVATDLVEAGGNLCEA